MRRTEAWWTCCKCGLRLVRPGKRDVKHLMLEHRKECYLAGFSIKQAEQRKAK